MFKIHKFFDVIYDNLNYLQAAKAPKITFPCERDKFVITTYFQEPTFLAFFNRMKV